MIKIFIGICKTRNDERFEKSFASHEKSKYLSVENKHTARQIFKFSGKKYNFKCK